MGLSSELWGWEFLPPLQLPQVFTVRGFEALFPHAGMLGCSVYLAPHLFLLVYLHTNVGPPGPLATALLQVLSAKLTVSTPLTSLDEYFFFNFLVVRLPYSSIFWQFWLFFVFKFAIVLLLVVRRGTVCLPTPPSWPEVSTTLYRTEYCGCQCAMNVHLRLLKNDYYFSFITETIVLKRQVRAS